MDETYSKNDELDKTPRGSIHTNAFEHAGSEQGGAPFAGMEGPTLFTADRDGGFGQDLKPSFFTGPGSSFRMLPNETATSRLNKSNNKIRVVIRMRPFL